MDGAPQSSRVLILDDDLATLTLERRVLERAGYAVVGVTTAAEAREAIRQDCPDLLVLDYRIEGAAMSGLDFYRALLEDSCTLPAILVTSFSDEARIVEALRAGIRDVVPKSGDYLEYLPEAVARVVKQTRAERSAAESETLQRVVEALRISEERLERLLESERAARAETERASRLKDEFLATLSHELRTPLNAILGWAQLLRARERSAADMAEGLQIIERNARVQAQIVDDLLEMSRIVSGKLRLDVQRVDLGAVIETAIQSVRPAADAKNIRLLTTLDPRAGPIAGDPARLQQVLWNLLSNAIKFTPKDGRVQVLLERVNSHIEMTVSDTGQGIRSEFLPFLFDRFRQGDASTTRQHRGMGLGLSIVKSLVEMHGGTVAARSEGEGCGATFTVKLPLTIARTPETNEDRVHPTALALEAAVLDVPRLTGLRVLVVDDEPDALRLLKRILMEFGAEVETVTSARAALPALQNGRPDVLVSDIGMPHVDGYELIRSVRTLPADRGGRTPALALTAFARSEDRQRALLAGYQAHVAKPVEPAELITLIASLTGRISARASSSSLRS